jgi:hypothetical protein
LIFAVLGPLVSFQDSDDRLVPLAAVAVPCRKLEFPDKDWALPALTTGTVPDEPLDVPLDADEVPCTVTVTVEEVDCPRLLVAVKVKT